MNICVFGDSVAKGVVYDEMKSKYTFLKDNFVDIASSVTHVTFKNFAKFGCTVSKGFEILEKNADKVKYYDYTILEFGGNDCDLNWSEISKDPSSDHLSHVPIEKFKNIYEEIIERIQALGSQPVLLTLPPLDSEKFFNWISKDLNKNNILKFLGNDINYISAWHESYNDMVHQLGCEFQIPVIDIRKDFLKVSDYTSFLCLDGMHPNEKGHRLIAKSLESALIAL